MHLKRVIANSIISMSLTLAPSIYPTPLADHIEGSILGGLIGDAHGKPTEFIKVVDDIFKKFPGGIITFEDLKNYNLVERNFVTGKVFACYTDDTAMARVTMQVLLEARERNWDMDQTMGALAQAYIDDMQNPTGWTMPGRAPGTTCKRAISELERRTNYRCVYPGGWWQAGEEDAGGCGSVMRAHPFGLVFADDPEKAAIWAAEHSKITHGSPMAQAACAAMAAGVAWAVQGKPTEFVIEQMIAWAKKYDPIEVRDNPYSCRQEKSTWGKMEDAVMLARGFTPEATDIIPLIPWRHPAEQYRYSRKIKIFETYQGWTADDAIAATLYIFTLLPNNVSDAIYLGVHTPGDSDSIASMAGALVGARVGAIQLQNGKPFVRHNPANYEGALILEEYAQRAAHLIEKK